MGRIGVAQICLGTCVCSSMLTVVSLAQMDQSNAMVSVWNVAWITVTVMLVTLAAATFDMYRLDPAPSHSLTTLSTQYFDLRFRDVLGWASYLHFMWVTRDCKKLQDDLLFSILKGNVTSEYGRRYAFQSMTNREDFIKKVPLSTYEDYRLDVNRMVERGEKNVTMSQDVIAFARSTGSSGGMKYFPINASFFKIRGWNFGLFCFSLRKWKSLKRYASLRYCEIVKKSPLGMPVASIGSLIFKPSRHLVSPAVVYQIPNEHVALYVHALFLLRERDIYLIEGYMAPLCYAFFSVLENECERLCRDLANGCLGYDVAVDQPTREAINRHLSPDASRAAEVLTEVSKGNIALAARMWPHLKCMVVVTTGAGFAHYRRLLNKTFLNKTPHVSHMHGASEGPIGFYLEHQGILKKNYYTMAVRITFFEFIPESQVNEEHPATLFVDQLESGRCYEVVLTTNRGLYRYRLGDVVKVINYVNGCPRYEFMYRLGMSLNVLYERTPEPVIVQTMHLAEREWENVHLVGYTATESHVLLNLIGDTLRDEKDKSLRYVFFVEVVQQDSHREVSLSPEQMGKVDVILQELFFHYAKVRRGKAVGPCQVVQLKRGTFDGLKQLMTKDTRTNQFKMPTVLRRKEALEFLLCNVI